jgi:RNA polymerase sigma factor (sigma-70 family)
MPVPSVLELPVPVAAAASLSGADDDATLVLAAQRDPRAFAHLYLRYVDPVYRYCHRRLGTKEAAEDATSLVFAKALAALPRYRVENASFRAWLFAIAHNAVVDVHRAAVVTRPLDAVADRPGHEPGPEAALLAAEERRTVDGLLAMIAPDQRRVLELRLAGLTTAEIAVALGRNPGAIRAIQCRAAKRLRELLGRGAAPEESPHA